MEDIAGPSCIDIESKSAGENKSINKMKKNDAGLSTNWTVPTVVAARLEVQDWTVANITKLLDEGCTIPFIARYRKEQTGGMEVQKLRDVCHMIDELKLVYTKPLGIH